MSDLIEICKILVNIGIYVFFGITFPGLTLDRHDARACAEPSDVLPDSTSDREKSFQREVRTGIVLVLNQSKSHGISWLFVGWSRPDRAMIRRWVFCIPLPG